MSLEQTTELYASVLMRLLPDGGYDTAQSTTVYDDVYAHAKLLAQTDIDAYRLLKVLESIPVELLNDYEREYALPMKCMVSSLSITERIEILRWVRTNRNVLSHAYLSQLLAVFGVTLVDIVKFKPMQCTTPCNAPVNTERLRYKVLLRLQYPMNADMSCIIENYLPSYLRVEWVVDMPWGQWILYNGYSLIGNDIRYTAYKTNQLDYYDSHADFDLVTALIRSFHDVDMQQWQGFKDAANQLTGVTDWVIDVVNNQIKYTVPADSSNPSCSEQYYTTSLPGKYFCSITQLGSVHCSNLIANGTYASCNVTSFTETSVRYDYAWAGTPTVIKDTSVSVNKRVVATPGTDQKKSIPLETVAAKVISNASSTDQAISIMAEAYIETVATSIFTLDTIKQFVKLTDLLSPFEINKISRN